MSVNQAQLAQADLAQNIYDLSWDSFQPDQSMFLRQFWEVQQDVYELAAGWIFWSFKHELCVPIQVAAWTILTRYSAAPWSWSQSAAQNWIPEDPTEKM